MNLLDIDSSGEQVGGDQNSSSTSSEFFHDQISLFLIHGSVHWGNYELLFLQFFSNFFNSLFGVTIDDTLLNFKVFIEFDEGIEFPFIFFDGNVILFDTIKGQFFIFD